MRLARNLLKQSVMKTPPRFAAFVEVLLLTPVVLLLVALFLMPVVLVLIPIVPILALASVPALLLLATPTMEPVSLARERNHGSSGAWGVWWRRLARRH
jgi:hypothetical protein